MYLIVLLNLLAMNISLAFHVPVLVKEQEQIGQ